MTPPTHPAAPVRPHAAFGLTAREASIAELLAARYRDREIAALLGISVHTVRRHNEHVFQKLGVTSRTQVVDRLTGEGG